MPLANSVARLLRETPQTTASHPLPLYNRILWDCGRHQGAVMVAYCNATSNALNIDWLRKFDNDATMFESYFASIYGGSAIVAPVQLEFVYNSVPLRSSFSALWTCTICTPYRQYGWLWAPLQDAVLNPSHLSDRLQPTPPSFNISFARLRTEDAKRRGVSVMSDESNGHSAFPGFFIHRLNGSCQHAFCDDRSHRKPVPDNAWVEVMRISRFESNTLASERCTIGQVFYWVAFGSGIWINVGRSVRPSRPQSPREHIDWTHRWNCDRAHELGFDTIQRLGDFSFELVDCRGLAERAARANETIWEDACPPKHTELRTGGVPLDFFSPAVHLPAHQGLAHAQNQSARRCQCDPTLDYLNCRLGD